MAFCEDCGKELINGAKFCSGCGTPVAVEPQTTPEPPAPPQQILPAPPQQYSQAGGMGGNAYLILEFKFLTGWADSNFFFIDANGKHVSANKLFNRSLGSVVVQDEILGFNEQGFAVKAEVYNDKIRFARLTKLGFGKPSEDIFEINGSEIASVQMSKTFLDKSITVVTHFGSRLKFEAPKKYLDRIYLTVNGMISGNP